MPPVAAAEAASRRKAGEKRHRQPPWFFLDSNQKIHENVLIAFRAWNTREGSSLRLVPRGPPVRQAPGTEI